MDAPAASERAEKPWDHPWTTDEMREKRTDWNLAGDSGLLQHLQQFSDKLMTTANKTQEALNSLTSELDDTIIFIDNITNTSLALANTQFIESRVCEDEVETDVPQGEQLEAPKTKEQLDAELIASIGESVRRGIAIMGEKYETVQVVASDSEDEGEIPIPSIILRPKDPYQDRPLPYIIGSEKWKNSSTIGLETSSSESEHPEEDESESDENIGPSTKPVYNLPNQRIARLSSSSSESNEYATTNNISRHPDDSGSNKNQDIFYSESEATTAANSLPKNSSNAAPNFAEELAKRLGTVAPMQKSINTQIIGEPALIQSKGINDLFTPEDDDLFGAPSKNVFNEPAGLFDEESGNSLWNDKSTKPFKSTVIPPSIDVPPPMNDVSTKPKSALDDLFGDADSEDSDDIFSGKTSTGKSFNQNNSPSANIRTEDKRRTNNLLSVGGLIQKEGMTTSTPETNDISNSLFDNDAEDVGNLFDPKKKLDDWTRAKTSIPDKTAGSTPAEASDTNNRKKPIGGVSILGNIDIFASGKLRRQASSDSSSSKSSSDFDTSRNRSTTDRNDTNSVINNNSADGNSVFGAVNMETAESSGISLRPPSIEDVTTGSNISAGFQPQMTSTWNKTGDMYRERIASDSLFGAKTLDNENENSLNYARINEVSSDHQGSEPSEEIDDIFGPPPLPKTGTKPTTKSKVSSLFDDSDSGDDLFSNTSSGSRSQKSADLLTTTTTTTTTSAANSKSSEKSKKIRNKGLFDDDDDEGGDLFGSRDSPQVNLFAAKATAKDRKSETVQEASASLSKDKKSEEVSSVVHERLDTSFERQNTVKISQTAPITKLGSIFDDLDDDDLFSPSFKKKTSTGQKAVAPNLFDDGAEDLFAVPTKSEKQKLEQKVESSSSKKSENVSEPTTQLKIGGEIKSKVMEQLAAKLEVVTTGQKKEVESDSKTKSTVDERSVKAEKSTEDKVSKNQTGKNINESKVLASKILDEIKTVRKSKIDGDVKPGIPKKPEVLKKLDRKLEAVNKAETRKDIVSSISAKTRSETVEETQVVTEESSVRSFGSERRISSSEDEKSSKFSKAESVITDHEALSESSVSEESSGGSVRRDPPKTLEIRSSTTSVSSEKSSAVQRRVVSGKIKNLMGRMSDLKIMSPTDTPPVFRKNEERVDEEGDKDSEDGSGFSTSKESPTLSEELPKLVAPPSPPDYKELEPAISFDQPVQVETLSVTASKSRVRIQSKRRPQSRRARQNALRKSGIDFETDDFSNDNNSDTNRNLFSISANNNPTSTENSANAKNTANSNTDRLIIPTGVSESVSVTVTESSSSTFFEDRSELSFSKESSLSINKNTLLSPSTDEEDLFDVPPDLPEDPPKEDALFGRAPILSPVESFIKVQKNVKQGSYKSEKRKDGVTQGVSQSKISTTIVTEESSGNDTDINIFEGAKQKQQIYVAGNKVGQNPLENEEQEIGNEISKDEWKRIESKDDIEDSKGEGEKEVTKELSDPLRDASHDPLKDPSNLFPFVTKTPSPEKGKNLLFNEEDDSLFSSSLSKKDKGGETVKSSSTQKKQTIDLFGDDTDVDFFAASLPKPARKSQKESKLNLFGDDDKLLDDDLFDGKSKKSLAKSDLNKSSQIVTTEKTTTTTTQVESSSSRKQSLFDESSDEQLFGNTKTSRRRETKFDNKKVAASSSGLFSDDDSSEIFTRSSKQKSAESTSSGSKKTVKDIFRDQSSGEEDMFAAKKTVIKKSTVSSSLFGNDDDDDDVGDIFGKSTSSLVSQSKSSSTRGSVVKKTNTRDLRKTAEKIVEDPLSMLQKD